MRDAPTYADAVQAKRAGDDPLGLATTNERLYNSALPGFNNYVRYIRVYSVLCWMCRQVDRALEQGQAKSNLDAHKLFKSAIEKMELAIVWANPSVPQLAGSRRSFPKDETPVLLQFDTFGRSEATLFEAVTYKPSLTNGLRFLEARSSGTYACLDFGNALADAFEKALRGLPEADWLRSADSLFGRRAQVASLSSVLDVSSPSASEQTAFLASFFPERLKPNATGDERARWSTLQLMLRAINAACRSNEAAGKRGIATSREIRACMARGAAANGMQVTPGSERVQAWWAVLQVRQLQRFCLESLYCVVERWIDSRELQVGVRTIQACAQELAALGHLSVNESFRQSVAQLEDYFLGLQGGDASLYDAAARWTSETEDEDNDADVFYYIDLLHGASLKPDATGKIDAVSFAYIGLVFCAVEAANLRGNPEALKAMKADVDPCSLLRLSELVARFRESSIEAFLSHLLNEWVILRHFSVVAARSVAFDGKNRFRFVMGDGGLERFEKSARLPQPAMSSDKLEHALVLCEQGGLLTMKDGGYKLSSRGRTYLFSKGH